MRGAGLRQQFDVRDPSFCSTPLSKFVVWGEKWQMKRSVPVQKAKAEVEEMLSKGNPTSGSCHQKRSSPISPFLWSTPTSAAPLSPSVGLTLRADSAVLKPSGSRTSMRGRLHGVGTFGKWSGKPKRGEPTKLHGWSISPMKPPLGWTISRGARARVPVTLIGSARSFSSACIVK